MNINKLSEAAGFGPCEIHPAALSSCSCWHESCRGARWESALPRGRHCALVALDKGARVTGNGPVGYRRPRMLSCGLVAIDTRSWITGTQLIACRGCKSEQQVFIEKNKFGHRDGRYKDTPEGRGGVRPQRDRGAWRTESESCTDLCMSVGVVICGEGPRRANLALRRRGNLVCGHGSYTGT